MPSIPWRRISSLRRPSAMLVGTVLVLAGMLPAAPRKAAPQGSPAKPRSEISPASGAASGPLDTAMVRRHYLDGDFDPAIELIEATLRNKRGFNHDDSVFMFKHLGVMYAAKYDTREKGKLYMRKLLEVEPTARILDMYASDMIYMIFKNIKDEFDSSRERFVRADTALGGGKGTGPGGGATGLSGGGAGRAEGAGGAKRKSGASTYFWVGATAVVAAGVATYVYFSDEPKTTTVNHDPD